MGNFLMAIFLFCLWIVMMLSIILAGLWIVQVGFRELFEVDILIRLKEWAQLTFAPKLRKAFFGKDGSFYISVPREILNNAKKLGNIDTDAIKERV